MSRTVAVELTPPLALSLTAPVRKVLNRKEAARHVGLSPMSLTRAIERGDLPKPIRIGRRVMWTTDALDAALDRLMAK